jgi:pyroglutamyl-peptidase
MTDPADHPPKRATPRLLVCGFGPFPGFPENPAARVVERLSAEQWSPDGVVAAYRLIPTTWAGGPAAAAEAARAFAPDAILVLGVAGGADRFQVEGRARNRAAPDRPDAEGALHPTAHILAGGADLMAAAAPLEAMVEAIAAEGLPVAHSTDAGDYLCNYVFYRLLAEAHAPRTAFLHLPPGLPVEDLARGTMAAASALIAGG